MQSIRIGSLAEEVGLDVDDEIVSVNGAHFRQLRHSEAVVNLKTPLQLDMVVRRRVKGELKVRTGKSRRNRGNSAITRMRNCSKSSLYKKLVSP